jgi:hypothetical protein
MNRTLGPRDVGDILKETFIIYKNNFWRLAAIVSVAAVLSAAAGLIINLLFPVYGETVTINWERYIISIPVYLIVSVVSLFTAGATIHAIAEQYFNRPISFSRAFSFAWRRLGVILGAFFLSMLAIIGLSITIIGIPAAIYFAIIWAFLLPAALLEGCGPRDALSHSSALVKQNWWRVLGILLLLALILWAIMFILSIPLGISVAVQTFTSTFAEAPTQNLTSIYIWSAIVSLIGGVIGVPIFTIGETLLYFDLRVRKQNYSLDALANELGLTSAPVDTGSNFPV